VISVPETIEVKLSENGEYWQGWYYDHSGQRRRVGIGPKSELSRRQANKLCVAKSIELTNNPALANASRVPTLGQYVPRYIAGRTDLKASSRYLYDLAGRYLLGHFGCGVRLDKISRAMAREWREAIRSGSVVLPKPDEQKGRPRASGAMSETTVCNCTKYAKSIFAQAVDDDLIPLNPFDKLKSHAPNPERDWHYVSLADFEKLVAACPSVGWSAMLGLCRLAGLRRGEADVLPWSGVDWQSRRITVYATKTAKTTTSGGKRVIPMEPRLLEILMAARAATAEGAPLVCNLSGNLTRDFAVIRKRAALAAWSEPFQTMRRNRETDWAQTYPQHAVSEWIGHDITVSQRFYLRVPEELYAKVSGHA
jgi:hypothetical protein